jgi:release factor glutamine methyltransferase
LKGAEILKEWTHQFQSLYDLREAENIARECLCLLTGIHQKHQLIEAEISKDFSNELSRLLLGEPWQYVCEKAFFYDLIFNVSPAVLIPRPETEELVHLILSNHSSKYPYKVLDLGTGSGCIPIAIAKNKPHWQITGIDIDVNALAIAQSNALSNAVNVNFVQGNILEINSLPQNCWDIIVSNPPYIPENEKQLMHSNVLNYEPHLALFVPDNDALKFYANIAKYAQTYLVSGGFLYFEINEFLAIETRHLLQSHDFEQVQIIKDLYGKDRMICAKKA